MEVNPTGYVVLGMLNWGPRTGYEIKQLVDRSTRFFWAASYGQIYPELKRLERAGLISGESEPAGGRNRRVFSLTSKGRRELEGWMRRPPETFEMRNEGLLKLFLAASEPPEEIDRHLGELGGRADRVAERLRGIRDEIGDGEIRRIKDEVGDPEDPELCLRFGIEMNEWIADWCERRRAELGRGKGKRRRAA